MSLYKIAASKYYDVPNEDVRAHRLIANAMDSNLPNATGNEPSIKRITNGEKYKAIAKNIAFREGFHNEKGQLVFKNPKHAKIYQTLANHPDVAYMEKTYKNATEGQISSLRGRNAGRAKVAVRDYAAAQADKVSPEKGVFVYDSLNSQIADQNLYAAHRDAYTPKQANKYLQKRRKSAKAFREATRHILGGISHSTPSMGTGMHAINLLHGIR